jgi:hypothetical protein
MKAIVQSLLVAACLAIGATSALAQAEKPKPFGLSLGMSREDAKDLGIKFLEERDTANGKIIVADNLPQKVSDAKVAILFFGYKDRLARVGIVSKAWENDKYGIRV